MAYVLDLSQSQTLTILKAYLQDLTGLPNAAVVQGQPNRIAAPSSTNYIVFTPLTRNRLATNVVKFSSSNATVLDQHTNVQSAMLPVQVDVYGPSSGDIAQILSTEFRSGDAVDYFAAAGLQVFPLYTSDPRDLPFTDEGDQVQMRWSIDCNLQIKPGVISPQPFADAISTGLINVDAEFPPT